ncbi:hypothetical protein [Sinorhizobium sp. CCBAU 05631]|uniref:hypothetical protein n=1 Tax=Sinorhizobium sp. CCBAU 05631 TaxID=794846 RepID=UPI0012F8ABD0|nr:hypothetical protein [Sinorhizobium sp. CCBAU 05631]
MGIYGLKRNFKTLPTDDSGLGMFTRVIFVGAIFALVGGGVYYTNANASGETPSRIATDATAAQQLKREIGSLRKELYNLRVDNASLRSEITTLTSQNGVVDVIIGHLRELKAQDQAILGMIQPASNGHSLEQDESGSEMAEDEIQGTARHQIVTPKNKAAPLPSPRPEKVVEAESAKDAPTE